MAPRKFKLRHVERKKIAEQQERTKAANAIKGNPDIVGSEEFMNDPPEFEHLNRRYRHNSEFMYRLNETDLSDVPDLMQWTPQTVERTILETHSEFSLSIVASIAATSISAFMRDYENHVSRQGGNPSIAPPFLFTYEGTLYGTYEAQFDAAEYLESYTMDGRAANHQTRAANLIVRANAMPDRHISKRNLR